MAFEKKYIDPPELEEMLENFENEGYSIVAVNIYNDYLVPKNNPNPTLSETRNWGYEVILKK